MVQVLHVASTVCATQGVCWVGTDRVCSLGWPLRQSSQRCDTSMKGKSEISRRGSARGGVALSQTDRQIALNLLCFVHQRMGAHRTVKNVIIKLGQFYANAAVPISPFSKVLGKALRISEGSYRQQEVEFLGSFWALVEDL